MAKTEAGSGGEAALIDVLLPVYNGAATIAESVRSLLAQTERRIRILVIDDGSRDDTARIVAGLAAGDARVVLLTKPNSGIVDALNLGIARSRAPFIARQDADDISFPDRFAVQLAAFEADEGIAAVSGSCLHITEDGAPTGTRYQISDPGLADPNALPSAEPYLLHPFLMVRREALIAGSGYRHAFYAEDTDLYWRLAEAGRLVNLEAPLGEMRLHAQSVSNASIVNGRIMAVHSQLAAVSARRRAEGRADIAFPADRLAAYREARTLERMLAIASEPLTPDERVYLRSAASAKLLSLAAGRMYELETSDCRFIRREYARLAPSQLGGRSVANWAYRASLSRFVRRRMLPQFLSLFDFGVASRSYYLRLTAAK